MAGFRPSTPLEFRDSGIYPHLMLFVIAVRNKGGCSYLDLPGIEGRVLCLMRISGDCCTIFLGVMAGSCLESCVLSSSLRNFNTRV